MRSSSLVDVDQVVETLSTTMTALAELDWTALPVAQRLNVMADLETQMRRLRAYTYAAAGSLACEERETLGDKPTNVLANTLRISPTEAGRRMRTAALLCERTTLSGQPIPPILDGTAPRWHAGAIDPEHLTVITKLLDDLPAHVPFAERQVAENFLAEKARIMRPDDLKNLADRMAATINPDGNFTDVDRARKCGITFGKQQPDGTSEIRGRATPELRAALEAVWGKLAAPGMCNPDDDTAQVDGQADEQTATGDRRTQAQRQHDGLLAACRSVLASRELGSHHGLPVTIIVTTTLDQLESGAGIAVTGSGTLIPMRDVIRWASHAYHYLAVFDRHSEIPLHLGRTRRTASIGQRIMLHTTDRGCSFPGCTVPGYLCQADHIDEWVNGGPTDINNFALDCTTHHKFHTNYGWKIRKRSDGRTEWIPPPHLGTQLQLPGGGVNNYHHPEKLLGPNDNAPD